MNWKRVLVLTLSAVVASVSFAVAQADVQQTMTRAKKLYRDRNFRGALEELNKAVQQEPERADALYLAGYSHLMLKQYSESVETFSRAFHADPKLDPRTIYRSKPGEPMD